MLKPTSLIMGAGLGYDVACLTDGRFSGGSVVIEHGMPFLTYSSHGFVVGHVVPEAQVGGPIALVQDGDMIHIDAEANTLNVDVSDEELARRKESWVPPPLKITQGLLLKYARNVADASHGCGELQQTVCFPQLIESDRFVDAEPDRHQVTAPDWRFLGSDAVMHLS